MKLALVTCFVVSVLAQIELPRFRIFIGLMSDDGVEFIGPRFYSFEAFTYVLPYRDRTTYLTWARLQQRNPRAGLDFPLPLLPDENAKKVKETSQPEVLKSESVEKHTDCVRKSTTSVAQPTDSLKRQRDSTENDNEGMRGTRKTQRLVDLRRHSLRRPDLQ